MLDSLSLHNLREEVVEVICLLKLEFPPTNFNICIHLLIHLEYELEHYGLVRIVYRYNIEWYEGLKKIVVTTTKPKDDLFEGYSLQEAMEFHV